METVITAYRRKPTEVWAVRYDGANTDTILAMIGHSRVQASDGFSFGPGRGMAKALKLTGIHTTASITVGNWVLATIEGFFWTMSHDDFTAEYEAVPPTSVGLPEPKDTPGSICWCGREVGPGENHAMCSPAMD